MKFINFIEEKIFFLLFQISFVFFISLILIMYDVEIPFVLVIACFLIGYTVIYLWFSYYKISKNVGQVKKLVNGLEEKYLITEILPKSKSLVNQGYYFALKEACKSMNDKISYLEKEQQEYQEYIESFTHEIKTPISALSLHFDNNQSDLKNEVEKIDNLIEQMLFYARSDNTEKDYFVKRLDLSEIVHKVLLKYRNYIIDSKILIEIDHLEQVIYTDEKWLLFILSQILQNAIKYMDKPQKKIKIIAQKKKDAVYLTIKDNGCGIKESDIMRIFEKGFTGSNRSKTSSTGIGLYLAKKICDSLGLKLEVLSKYSVETAVTIIFPESAFHQV